MLPGVFVALPLGLLGRRFGDRLVLGAGLALMALGALVSFWAGTARRHRPWAAWCPASVRSP